MTTLHSHVDLAYPPLKLADFPRRHLEEDRELRDAIVRDEDTSEVTQPAVVSLNIDAPTTETRAI